jgi:hypothetical protein
VANWIQVTQGRLEYEHSNEPSGAIRNQVIL